MAGSLRSLRRAFALVLAVAAAGALGACSGDREIARANPASAPPVQLAVLGDSLAFGTGAGDTSGGFAFRLYEAIAAGRPGSEITNVAINGSTAADVLRLQTSRLRERRFSVVILCVGGNDVVRGIPTTAFARTYRRLVAAIRAAAPQAAFVVIGVPDVSISPLFADHARSVRQLAAADDQVARRAALADGARYVDLFALTRRENDAAGFLSQDRFHPSDAGHAQIAAYALPVVEAALRAAHAGEVEQAERLRHGNDQGEHAQILMR
jgi:lysophospholipase L1-like esterase